MKQTSSPHNTITLTSWAVDTEGYLQYLLKENQQLTEINQHKEALVMQASQDVRDPLTNLYLRLYLLEHSATSEQTRHIDSLKESITALTGIVEDLLVQVRQNSVPAADVPAGHVETNGFTGRDTLSDTQ